MSDEHRQRRRYTKRWPHVFAIQPGIEDKIWENEVPYIENDIWTQIRPARAEDRDELAFLLQDSEELGPCWLVDEVRDFCQGARPHDFESEAHTRSQRRAAWLDDRSTFRTIGGRDFRFYQNPLSATALYEHLKALVGGSPKELITCTHQSH
jgi:hypothetical protein